MSLFLVLGSTVSNFKSSKVVVALQVPISEIYEKIPTDNFRKSSLFFIGTSPEVKFIVILSTWS
jgi:hypothetical protein